MNKKEMNCKKICDLLTAYLDGEVTPQEKDTIESHLGSCPHCRHEMELFKAAQTGLRDVFMITAGNAEPSAQVWSRIRTHIESENNRPAEGIHRWLNRNLLWQTAVAAAGIVIILFAASVWQFGSMSSAPNKEAPTMPAPGRSPASTPAPAPAPQAPEESMPSMLSAPDVEAAVSTSTQTDAFSNAFGKTIRIETYISNVSQEDVTLSPYPPAVQVLDPFDYSTVRSFPAGNSTYVLQAGQSTAQSYKWDQRNDQGQQVHYGYYYIQPDVILAEAEKAVSFDGAGAAEVLILPEEGVLQKTITVDQTQTIAGTTVTMKRVEMTAANTRFFASTSTSFAATVHPEDSGYGVLPPPAGMVKAQYRIDNGPVQDIGYAEIGLADDGMEFSWTQPYISPVPQTAETLTFIITAVNGGEDRWEFTIPLK
jgi:anti-sigma factor RsiW